MSAVEEKELPSAVSSFFQDEPVSILNDSSDIDSIYILTLRFPLNIDPVVISLEQNSEETEDQANVPLDDSSSIRCICTSKNFVSKRKNWEFKGNTKVSAAFFSEWERHWSETGKQIVWESWFDKYQEYINPNYDILQLEKDTEANSGGNNEKKVDNLTSRGFELPYDDEEDTGSGTVINNSKKEEKAAKLAEAAKQAQDIRWQEAWEEHTQQVYWQEYSRFYIEYQPGNDLAAQLEELSLNPENQAERFKLKEVDLLTEEQAVEAFMQHGLYFKGSYFYDGLVKMPKKYLNLDNSGESCGDTNEPDASIAQYLDEFIENEGTKSKTVPGIYGGKRRRIKTGTAGGQIENNLEDEIDVYYEAMDESTKEEMQIDSGVPPVPVSLPNKRRANTHIRFRHNDDGEVESITKDSSLLEEDRSENVAAVNTNDLNAGGEVVLSEISNVDADSEFVDAVGDDEDDYKSVESDVNQDDSQSDDNILTPKKGVGTEKILDDSECDRDLSTDENTAKDLLADPNKKIPKKKKKKKSKNRKKNLGVRACPDFMTFRCDLKKYWKQRYKLFSKYDEGILLDADSWFSVTPEAIAAHIADRCKHFDVIIDAFCGCGGNTIQFAKKCSKVIAIDIDPVKVDYARNNAAVYGVEDKIEFIVGDFMELASTLQGDVVFLSPPWGGPSYLSAQVFDLETMIPMNGIKLFDLARTISANVAYYVPRNVDVNQLAILSGLGSFVEIEKNMDDGRVKAITAYYGELIRKSFWTPGLLSSQE